MIKHKHMKAKNLNKTIGAVLLFLILLIGYLLYRYNSSPTPPPVTTTTTSQKDDVVTPTRGVPPTVAIVKDNKVVVLEAVVEMNENGYKPTTVEVSVGGQVRFVNTSTQQVMGPKGKDWGGLYIKPNLSFTQLFDKSGTYSYTDVNNSKFNGEVIVK